MSTENLEKDPAPSAIRYLVLGSALVSLLTALSFIQAQIGTSTQEEQFFQSAMLGFSVITGLTLIEWFLLRRSRKMIGPYGFAFVIEIMKTILLNLTTIAYIEAVSGASSSQFFLHQIISLGIIFMLALTKVARTRIDQLAQKDISRNLLNLIPTLLIIALFMGTYVTEIVGLGTPRQRRNFEDYTDKYIDWDLYNTPTWDATYLLENLLDQFTAGIQFPNEALFNVSNTIGSDPTFPPSYWRLGSLETYEYFNKGQDPTTRWTSVDPIAYRVLTPYTTGTPYSDEIDMPDRTAQYTVTVPLDYSDSIADVSVNPSFTNYLPTTWNGRNGSYIDVNSFKLYDANGNELNTVSMESKEAYPGAYGPSFHDLLGIYADVRTSEMSTDEGIFEYTMNYKDITETLYDAAMWSKTKDDYPSVLAGGTSEWRDIETLYMHYPNTIQEIPESPNVHGVVKSRVYNNYTDWAPLVVDAAGNCTVEGQTVFSQAYSEMQRLAPVAYIKDQQEHTIVNSTGKFGLKFDFDMWLGNQNPLQDMAHPADHEDYNEWFLFNKNGVSLHFASLYATIMRLRGIPSRVVIGYLGGESSDDGSKRIITNMMLHAWAEVLIPIEEIIIEPTFGIDQRAEWISFDPLLKFLTDFLELGTPLDMPVLSQVENVVLIDSNPAYVNQRPDQSISAIGHCTTDDLDFTTNPNRIIIDLQQTINISVRLMMATSPATWIPWQPSCDYIGTEVRFYLDTSPSLSSFAVSIANASIDGSGYSSCILNYDIMEHGDTVWFFAVVIFDEDTPQEEIKIARSYRHSIF